MWQPVRSNELEILDLGSDYYSPEEYDECLSLLYKVNRLLGGFKATEKAFKALPFKPQSILEVGCGGGYLCQVLHQAFPEVRITGIDLSTAAIAHAKFHCNGPNVSFSAQREKKLEYDEGSFDVVTTMLVCHHMTDEELVQFLKEAYRTCSQAVIINDLQRHFLAYASFSLIAPIAFPNRLIWNDGRLSVKRGFRRADWIRVLKQAGFRENQWMLKWNWAFRWTLTLRKM